MDFLLKASKEFTQKIPFIKIQCDFTKKEIEVNGPVTDTTYNRGVIVRERDGKIIHTFGEELKGDALIDSYCRSSA